MFKEKSFYVLLFCSIVLGSTALLQYLIPTFRFFDYGLFIAILLTVFLKKNSYTLLFCFISLLFIAISIFYRRDHFAKEQMAMQYMISGVIIVTISLCVLYIKKIYRSIDSEGHQLNALFEHATEGIVLTDDKGEIVLINPAAARLFQYNKETLLGKSIETLIPTRYKEAHLNYRKGFNQHPSNRTMGHGRDLFAKAKDGTEFPVEVSLSFYHQNNNFFVIAFIVDITSRKKSEQELLNQKKQLERITEDMRKLNTDLETKVEQRTLILREALQELEKSQRELNEALSKEKELNEIKSRFVSMASHEFRTPLSTVLSSAALISKYTQVDEQEKRDKHIKRIKESVRQLNDLLEDFLSLGKLEDGRIRAEPTQFNVHEFIEEVIEEMNYFLKENQSIRPSFKGTDQFITDKRLLKNILINLLGNAIKFSSEQSTICLTINNSFDAMELWVSDEGIGISDEDQQHLFSSFYRGKNVIHIEGTGLGLHIVKRYVDLLQGSINLESKLNMGTTIAVRLPILS